MDEFTSIVWLPQVKTIYIDGSKRYIARIVKDGAEPRQCSEYSDYPVYNTKDPYIVKFRWKRNAVRAAKNRAKSRNDQDRAVESDWVAV